jgi:hypothetical protein
MRARAGTAAVGTLLLGIAFALSLAGGFVYAHEPQPEQVDIRVDSSRAPDGERILPGTITATANGTVEVTTVLGAETVPLDRLVTEDLLPLEEAPAELGAPANVGGTRSDAGYVLSGVVIISPDAVAAP